MIGVLASSYVDTGAATLTGTYVTTVEDVSNGTTYTHSGVSFGTASADRVIVVAIDSRCSGGSPGAPTVTIGGVSATVDTFSAWTSSDTTVAMVASAPVPTGTSGDVVVTWSKTVVRCAVSVYAVTGGTVYCYGGAAGGATSSGALTTADVDSPAGGFVLANIAANYSSTGLGATWTSPLVEDYAVDSAETSWWLGASCDTATAATVSPEAAVSPAPSGESAMAVASYGSTAAPARALGLVATSTQYFASTNFSSARFTVAGQRGDIVAIFGHWNLGSRTLSASSPAMTFTEIAQDNTIGVSMGAFYAVMPYHGSVTVTLSQSGSVTSGAVGLVVVSGATGLSGTAVIENVSSSTSPTLTGVTDLDGASSYAIAYLATSDDNTLDVASAGWTLLRTHNYSTSRAYAFAGKLVTGSSTGSVEFTEATNGPDAGDGMVFAFN